MQIAAAPCAPAEALVLAMRLLALLHEEEARTLKASVPVAEIEAALRLMALLEAAREKRACATVAALVAVLALGAQPAQAKAAAAAASAEIVKEPEPLHVIASSFAAPLFHESNVALKVSATNADEAARAVGRSEAELGTSELPLSDGDRARAPGLKQFPVAAGAVAIVVNLPEAPGLRLSSNALVAIFLGRAQQWDDKRIANCNPGIDLPARRIVVARRSDPNGASAVLTRFFLAEMPWLRTIPGPQAVFPAALALRGDEAVAEAVARVPDSIGYVELSRAAAHGLRAVPLLLSDGRELVPTAESVRLALEEPSAPGAWPLTVRISAFVDTARGEPGKPLAGLAETDALLADPQAIAAAGLFPLPATIATLVRGRVADHAAALRSLAKSDPTTVAFR